MVKYVGEECKMNKNGLKIFFMMNTINVPNSYNKFWIWIMDIWNFIVLLYFVYAWNMF